MTTPNSRNQTLRSAIVVSIALVLIFLVVLLVWQDSLTLEGEARIMGISIHITATGTNRDKINEAINVAFDRMRQIDQRMSDYREDSEISKIKRAAGKAPVAVSHETFAMIQKAIEYSKQTDGAFDMTVRPLVALWRDRTEEGKSPAQIPPNNAPPSEQEILATLRLVGYDKIVLDPAGQTVWLPERGMSIDLGAIAKGYAVDEAIRVLRAHGVENSLVNAGGDLYAAGINEDGKPWTVLLRDPYEKDRSKIRVWKDLKLHLTDKAVTTSGNYERYILIGGQRFNHILDPRTGRPVKALDSVTVVAGSCLEADVLSTVITVVGVQSGLELLKQFEGASFYAIPEFQSPGFDRHLEEP